jgi:tetratricopeptide (TPR) repeat protein
MTGRMPILMAILVVLLGTAEVQAARSEEAIKRNNFGADLLKQGKLDEAVLEFRRAIEIDPTYAAAHLNLGYAYERGGRLDEAIGAYRKAIQLEPGALFAHNNLGVLYDKKALYDEAIAAFERALRIDPSNAMVLKNLENARKNKAIIQEREARIAEARKQVEARPTDSRAAYNLARVYASLDEKEQALQWLAKAVERGFDDFGFLKADPALAGLRGDPRFASFLEGR